MDPKDNVIKFPRMGGRSTNEQYAAGKAAGTTGNTVLSAIAKKYPELRVTTDEIEEGRAYRPTVQFLPNENAWRIVVTKREKPLE